MAKELQAIGAQTVSMPSKVSDQYVTSLDKLMQEMKGKSLVVIIEDSIAYEVRLNRENSKLTLQLKQISEDRVQSFTKEKVAIYDRTHNVWTSSLSVTGHVVTAAVGLFGSQAAGQSAQMIMNVLDKGNDGLSRGFERSDTSATTKVDYQKEIYQTSGSEQRQGYTQTGQMHREMDSLLDRVHNVVAELVRSIYGS